MMLEPRVTLRGESTDLSLNRDVLAVCEDVVAVCGWFAPGEPPLGRRPYGVRQAPDDTPRACLDGLPDEYVVNVTCLHTRQYSQLAFQVAHEWGHFQADPHTTNWFIESMCTALALLCLSALAERWSGTPPFANWAAYAPRFEEYRADAVQRAVRETGLAEADIAQWTRAPLPGIVASGSFRRSHEVLCAAHIAALLGPRPGPPQYEVHTGLAALRCLGAASREGTRTDFALWRSLVSEQEQAAVEALAEAFGPGFGAGA